MAASKISFALLLALLAALAPHAFAAAPELSPAERIEVLNKRAMENYDLLEFAEARKVLLEAIDIIKRARLNDAVAAKTHLNLGIVYVAGLKDRYKGLSHFVKALQIDPSVKIDKAVETPELKEVFDSARETVGLPKESPDASPRSDGAVPLDTNEARGIIHKVVEEAPLKRPLVIRALLGPDVSTGRLFLSYRNEGEEEFTSVPMTRKGGETYQAKIPASVMVGKTLQYYLDVEDARGRTLASAGSPSSPNLIALVRPEEAATEEGEEEVDPDAPVVRKRAGRFFIAVGIGSGIGWATGTSELAMANIQSGIAPALTMHITPEFGYFFTDRFALTLQGRFQMFTMADPMDPTRGTPASGAVAVLARGQYFFGVSALRAYVTLALGGGNIRHTVDISARRTGGATDTVAGGPFFAGPGLGVQYDLTNAVGLLFEVQSLVGYSEFTANVDAQIGILFRL